MRRTEGHLAPILIEHAVKYYGPEAVFDAWDEFNCWENAEPLDLEDDSNPEIEATFLPWFVYHWIPDDSELPEADQRPEMPVAMHYLTQMGNRMDLFEQQFITEVCSQPYSYSIVTDVEPGKSLSLKDILLEREIIVHERSASNILKKGDIIYTRIVTIDTNSVMLGAATTIIPSSYLSFFIDLRENYKKSGDPLNEEILLLDDLEFRSVYFDIKEQVHNPPSPQFRNYDGDDIEPTKLFYSLNCSPDEATEKLASLSFGGIEDVLEEGKFDKHGNLQSITFPWLNKKNTVLGTIEIKGNKLTIDVNSRERAEAIKRKITRRLGKKAVFKQSVIQSIDKMLEDAKYKPTITPPASADIDTLMATPEHELFITNLAEQHWKNWLDESLPALNNQTPREAAKTKTGRELLEALFLDFERYVQEEQSNLFSPDINALRQSLGLEKNLGT